ncbi:MAG TPA: cytochrome c, partial [Polyangiaceae bacterium]
MNPWSKRIGIALGGVGIFGLALFSAASIAARARLGKHYDTHRIALPLPAETDAAAVARGKHLFSARYGCAGCHGQNLGGGIMIDDPAIGDVRGPNLTRGAGNRTANYTMSDWDRIVRHGVKPDGTPAIMPSGDFFQMSDAELSDIVAYVRSVPPVDAAVPAPSFGPVGKVLLALGKMPISAEHLPAASHPNAPPPAADNAQFGEHLAATCVTCHRQNLAGGPMPFGPPSWPAAANLTQHSLGLRAWNFDDFDHALTRGL